MTNTHLATLGVRSSPSYLIGDDGSIAAMNDAAAVELSASVDDRRPCGIGAAVKATLPWLTKPLRSFLEKDAPAMEQTVQPSAEPRYFRVRLSQVIDDRGPAVGTAVTLSEVADLGTGEWAGAHLRGLLSVLSHVKQAIARRPEQDALLSTACHAMVDLGGFRFAWVGMLRDLDGTMEPVALSAGDTRSLSAMEKLLGACPAKAGQAG